MRKSLAWKTLTYRVHLQLVAGKVGPQLVQVRHDGQLVGHRQHVHVPWFDDARNAQLFRRVERRPAVLYHVSWGQLAQVTRKINQN